MLPDRVTVRWLLAAGEDFPTPRTDELVVFKDYFFRGFGVPIHPFLRELIAYYNINLCNLGPPSYMSLLSSIFANHTLGSVPISICSTTFSVSKSRKGLVPEWLGELICHYGMGW